MKKSFTLIELLLYIGLMAVVLNVGIYFVWQIIGAKTKNLAHLEVEKNLILSLEKISYETKRAKSLEKPQPQGQETSELVLRRPNSSLIRFYLLNNRLFLENPSNPSGPEPITNERTKVDELIFRNLSSALPGVFQVKIKVSYNNPSQRNEYQAEISAQKTITLRDNNE